MYNAMPYLHVLAFVLVLEAEGLVLDELRNETSTKKRVAASTEGNKL